MKKAFRHPRVLAALGSLASIFLLAGPTKGAAIDYVTVNSQIGGAPSITYDSMFGLSVASGSPNITVFSSGSTPSTNVLGLTAASNSLGAFIFDAQNNRTATASASSYANLATGTIGAGAAGTPFAGNVGLGSAAAVAQMQDSITFNNTSGQTANIDVYWTFDGTAQIANAGSAVDILFCLGSGAVCQGNPLSIPPHGPVSAGEFFRLHDSLGLGLPSDPFINEPTTFGWVSGTFTPSINADSGTFHGVFAVPTGVSTDSLNAYIALSNSGTTSDFTHTGTLSFGNLNGVSFTSASGVLLTQTPAAVPEPGNWILMMAGLGLIGLAKWRKPRTGAV
jgi:hypothetical protein